jgi:hypothetical protein
MPKYPDGDNIAGAAFCSRAIIEIKNRIVEGLKERNNQTSNINLMILLLFFVIFGILKNLYYFKVGYNNLL